MHRLSTRAETNGHPACGSSNTSRSRQQALSVVSCLPPLYCAVPENQPHPTLLQPTIVQVTCSLPGQPDGLHPSCLVQASVIPSTSSTMPDILNHQPAKPATSFPGRWLLDLPSTNTQIHIRRYRAISRDDPKRDGDNGPSDASTIIERLKSDPLEAGWKRVNSVDNPGGGGAAVRRILAPGQATCGVIICEDPKDPSGNAAKQASSSPVARELWCFHLSSESSEEPQSPFDEADELEGEYLNT